MEKERKLAAEEAARQAEERERQEREREERRRLEQEQELGKLKAEEQARLLRLQQEQDAQDAAAAAAAALAAQQALSRVQIDNGKCCCISTNAWGARFLHIGKNAEQVKH